MIKKVNFMLFIMRAWQINIYLLIIKSYLKYFFGNK